MKRQRGVVIIVASLLLLVITLAAVGVATRSRSALQMTSATNARSEALHLVNGAQAGFLETQRLARGQSVLISNAGTVSSTDAQGVVNTVSFRVEAQCRRSRKATATGILTCRHSELESAVAYGKSNRGGLSVVTGLEQPVLSRAGG